MLEAVEMYKLVSNFVTEENDRRVNLIRNEHDEEGMYQIVIAQIFSRDMRQKAWDLFRESGFEVWENMLGKVSGKMNWHHFGRIFQVEASLLNSESVVLEVSWKFDDCPEIIAPSLRDNVRVMNRIFNLMKAKLEAE